MACLGEVCSSDEDVTYQDDVGSLDLFLVEEEVLCRISSSGSHVLIFCVGVNISFGKKFRVGNMLPALIVPVIYEAVAGLL